MDAAPDAAFASLVAEHEHGVLRVCRSILRDEHLGADAAQETFVRLWRRLVAGRRPARAGPWLHRVAVTTSLDLLRRRAAREGAHDRAGRPRSPAAADPAPPPPAELSARELEERFALALDRLPDGQRTVFLLRHAGGMSLARVAETLELSLPTVKTQFARACVKLQEALRPFDPRPDPVP